MKASELIELLRRQDPEAPVFIVYPSHDHKRTALAAVINTVQGHNAVKWSEYHRTYRVADDKDLYYPDGTPLDQDEMDDEGIRLGVIFLTMNGGS